MIYFIIINYMLKFKFSLYIYGQDCLYVLPCCCSWSRVRPVLSEIDIVIVDGTLLT